MSNTTDNSFFNDAKIPVDPRGWNRLTPPNEETIISLQRKNDCRREPHLVDRSLGGVALRVPFSSWFQVGDTVSVEFFGAPAEAIVRQKRQMPDGTWRLGLEWIDGQSQQ